MKLNYKFGIYCFCTGVFLANCSPENNESNGGSSNSKENIENVLAAVQLNNNISEKDKKELTEKLHKQREYNVTPFEDLSSDSEAKIKNAKSEEQIIENIRSSNLKNKINKSLYDAFDKIIDPFSKFSKNLFSYINDNYDEIQKQLLTQYLMGSTYESSSKKLNILIKIKKMILEQ